jgi:hypothetical protein
MFSTSAGAAGSLSGGAVACSRPWRTSSWYIFWYMVRIRKRTDLSMSTVFDTTLKTLGLDASISAMVPADWPTHGGE